MTPRAPSVHPRSAEAGAGTRTIEVFWHADGAFGGERCIINVFRRDDGTPMIEVSAPDESPVTVAYDGLIEGVEDIVDEEVDDLVTINANKGGG